jgi:hypothetical protein
MTGRSTLYTAEIAERILDGLANGRSLRAICEDEGISGPTVQGWVREDREGFAARFHLARQIGGGSPRHFAYTPEIADKILGALIEGRTLTDLCGDPDMPDRTTISRWVAADRDGFAERYRRARDIGHGSPGRVAYSPAVADRILDELMNGRTLVDVCKDPDTPAVSTVNHWAVNDREGFAARYSRAREIGCHTMADQMLEIVDDRSNDWIVRRANDGTTETILDPERVARARLRCDVRRWLLSKMLPKAFGDRQNLNAKPEADSGIAELLKLVDGSTRGLPSTRLRPETTESE